MTPIRRPLLKPTGLHEFRGDSSPFTVPRFEPSDRQIENMTALSDKLLASQLSNPRAHALDLAELYRELGRFDEAQLQIRKIPEDKAGITSKLLSDLIDKNEIALVRYRM